MCEGSVGIVKSQSVTLLEPPNELLLDCGRRLGPVQVAYETYGQLSNDKDNAVWICHALSGDAHAAGRHHADDAKPGWWDDMVGPGKAIDTDRYFVVCSNILGGCKGTTGPGSINPATNRRWGLDFPVITIADMVRVQRALMEHLGLERLLAVVGGSMGGMQVLEWATRYADLIAAALPIATTARLSAQAIAFNAVGRNAILGDADFQNGRYDHDKGDFRGLAIARMIGHITYLSEQSMHKKFGRALREGENYRYDFDSEFAVETYLDYKGKDFVERFDANSYLYISKAMDYFDLYEAYGSAQEAFREVTSRFLIASFTSDWLFTSEQSRQMTQALLANGKDVTYCNIESPYGHDAFLLEPQTLGRLISGFLAGSLRKLRTDRAVLGVVETEAGDKSVAERFDLPVIAQLVRDGSRVLDLGCGDGRLLQLLSCRRNVGVCGVEIKQSRILDAVDRGVTVVQHDLDHGLPDFPDDSFDYVILSQTLPEVHNPQLVFREMLRIGRYVIVSFPNFAHWRARWQLAFRGRAPVTETLPAGWYDTERIRFLSIRDFEQFCEQMTAKIITRRHLGAGGKRVRLLCNLRAAQTIIVISRIDRTDCD